MTRRIIGQERFSFTATGKVSDLDELARLIDWSEADALMAPISSAAKGEPGWPPLCLLKALVLARWYDLSDVKLAEALDDRASFRRFCGFARTEATPERTAFVRFRQAVLQHGLGEKLFTIITQELCARNVAVKHGTLVDATIIASASKGDDEARWVKHRNRKAVHGYKAHVACDEDSALIENLAVTPANINDGKAGCEIIPEDPGEVYADSAYRGTRFRNAVAAHGGRARVVATAVWARDEAEAQAKLAEINAPIHQVRGRIEKIFGTCKHHYGLRRLRYVGLAKA
ncbi:MAG TPA: IS5 family transposase, partial [Alphaproteobacteria bacterium]|nr:IS5 family transposase [Alphaproteobacteria bacterium]